MSVDGDRVVVRYAFEKVKRWIAEYKGPPGKLKPYLLERLHEYLDRADTLLANMITDLFEYSSEDHRREQGLQ